MTLPKIFLDHVAVAVKDLELGIKIYSDLGLEFDDAREIVNDQGVITAFAPVDENAHLELLAPIDDDGTIAGFIKKSGEGIHHLCFSVKDIVEISKDLTDKGYQLIYPQPVKGANNCLVNFIHPKSTGGVLIELLEKKGNKL